MHCDPVAHIVRQYLLSVLFFISLFRFYALHVTFLDGRLNKHLELIGFICFISAGAEKRLSAPSKLLVPPQVSVGGESPQPPTMVGANSTLLQIAPFSNCSHSEYEYTSDDSQEEESSDDWSDEDDVPKKRLSELVHPQYLSPPPVSWVATPSDPFSTFVLASRRMRRCI